jgi:tetratricopeptide (TPR) repeat protein
MIAARIEFDEMPKRGKFQLREDTRTKGDPPKIGACVMTVFVWFVLILPVSRNAAASEGDVERTLSEEVARLAEAESGRDLSMKERGYVHFLLAVYRHDARSREKAEEIYRTLGTPESRAFLGSIDLLKARDATGAGFFGGLLAPFKRLRDARRGVEKLDSAVRENPSNLDIRVVRMITYLELPSFFGKFRDGFDDMKTILRWMEEGTVRIPDEEPLLRDRSSVFYYAGRYFLKSGQRDKAREMFLKSTKTSPHSPFGRAAGKMVLRLR